MVKKALGCQLLTVSDDNLNDIGSFLDLPSVRNFAQASKSLYNTLEGDSNKFGFFKATKIQKVLQYVVFGLQDKAQEILKKNPTYIFEKADVIDYSGRVFKQVSPFLYALWALDRHMWRMMLESIYENETPGLLELALDQYKWLEMKGINYQLNNQLINEKHFSLSPLLKRIKEHIDNYDNWKDKDCVEHWRLLGFEQRLIPPHIASEICMVRIGEEEEIPDFRKSSLVRTVKFQNGFKNQLSDWFPLQPSSGLGFDFAIKRISYKKTAVAGDDCVYLCGLPTLDLEVDHAFLSKLDEVRMEEYSELNIYLKNELKEIPKKIKIENRHNCCPIN